MEYGDVVLLSPRDHYSPRLETAGFRWIPFPISRRGLNPILEAFTILRLFRIYRREKPDVVHHFTVKCMLYGSLAARLAGIPAIVNSVTGLGYAFTGGDWRRRLLQAVIRAGYRFAFNETQIIFQNPDDCALFLDKRFADPAQANLIRGSGVDLSLFQPSPEPDGRPLVLLAARMLWDKGVGEFVEAARQLRSSGLDARFVLVGDTDAGNPSAIPLGQLRAWQKEGIVEWLGWRDDMPLVMASANIACLPSYKEGLPRFLLEAGASGRPIVTTDVPGCREVVRHGVNGLLVPARDPGFLAQALQTLLADAGMRHRLGAQGRRLVEEEFSLEKVIQATLAVYEKALHREFHSS